MNIRQLQLSICWRTDSPNNTGCRCASWKWNTGYFLRRDDVLTVSLHADPERFYPFFWGYEQEKGEGQGLGYNLNLPLARGTGDDDFLNALDIGLARRNFGSDVIVVALGLDASIDDPFEGLAITQTDLNASARALLALACLASWCKRGYISDSLGINLTRFLNESKVDAITSDAQNDGVKSQQGIHR